MFVGHTREDGTFVYSFSFVVYGYLKQDVSPLKVISICRNQKPPLRGAKQKPTT
jgi:hypothetical protein